MNKVEIKGMLKGIGIASVLCASIFYGMILNLRTDYEMDLADNSLVIEKARDLGMIFISEANDFDLLTKDYIIRMARSYGMEFVEEVPD